MSSAVAAFDEGIAAIDFHATLRVLRVEGSDALSYLQRMVSADLRKVSASQGTLATLMTHKGKLVAAFDLYVADAQPSGPTAFWLVLEAPHHETLREHLEKFIILEDVQVEETGLQVWSLQGPKAAQVLAALSVGEDAPASEYQARSAPDSPGICLVARRNRSRCGGFDVILEPQSVVAFRETLESLDAEEFRPADAEPFRIEAGVPVFGVDATDEQLAPEAGYESALSYDKGCYAGQEVVARIRTYGHVNKCLRRITWDGTETPAAGDEIFVADKKVGWITSTSRCPRGRGGIAMGYLRLKEAPVGAEVAVRAADGDFVGIVRELKPDPEPQG